MPLEIVVPEPVSAEDHLHGKGVPADCGKALEWLARAAGAGVQEAVAMRKPLLETQA